MTYTPKDYWDSRENPTQETEILPFEREFLEPLIDQAETIFELGPGVGRLAPLYSGKRYFWLDITNRYKSELTQKLNSHHVTIDRTYQVFELGVAVKVFLHIPPDLILNVLNLISGQCQKVAVIDICTDEKLSEHNFSHDFKSLLGDRITYYQKKGNQIRFIYR